MLVIAPAAYAGYATETAREAADEIFVEPEPVAVGPTFTPEPDPEFLDEASPSPALPSARLGAASPSPSASPTVPRITGLVIGVDSGVGRNTYLTDTMIVVSLDPVSDTVSMVSIPRDMVDVPFSDGRKFRGKINSLVSYARHHTKQFPGRNGKGFDVLMDALGTLLGVPIQYYAIVNLGGFVRVIDTLGGVNVNVARSFCDPKYSEYGYERGFSITAGRHHLNGQQALAYARVRRPAGESDFTRAARQQEVLSGVRDAVVKGGFLNDPVGLLKALPGTIETNVPRKALPDLAEAANAVGRGQTYRAVVTHPLVRSGYRHPRLHPDPRHPRHPRARRNRLPAERDGAAGEVPGARGGRQGQRQRRPRLRPGRHPKTDRQADPEADTETQTVGRTDAHAGADTEGVAFQPLTPPPVPDGTFRSGDTAGFGCQHGRHVSATSAEDRTPRRRPRRDRGRDRARHDRRVGRIAAVVQGRRPDDRPAPVRRLVADGP